MLHYALCTMKYGYAMEIILVSNQLAPWPCLSSFERLRRTTLRGETPKTTQMAINSMLPGYPPL